MADGLRYLLLLINQLKIISGVAVSHVVLSLHGYKGALSIAGLTLNDVKLVEVHSG